MIRLLIADDSALMRKMLERIFLAEGDFDVRLAPDGARTLELIGSFDPHVITLDVQMPGMDGLTCLSRIMLAAPRPVVMISAITAEGTEATLEAMELGAVDFVTKPFGTVSLEIDRFGPLVVEKVRGAAKARIRSSLRLTERIRHRLRGSSGAPPTTLSPAAGRQAKEPQLPRPQPAVAKGQTELPGLVLMGCSTGGPAALDLVLPQLPGDFPWPVMVAQHMPASFTRAFAHRLDRRCPLRVVEVGSPLPLEAGTIYIGRGDADLVVARRGATISAVCVPMQRDYPWHPSVERLVTSALDHMDAGHVLGVLMTGMGRDGADAMTRLRARGGRTIAEAASTAVVWGMPGELVKNGGAALVAPIDDIAAAIVDAVNTYAAH